MADKIIFHLPSQFVEDFETKSHLALFTAIKRVIEQRGGTTQAVPRDKRLRSPKTTGWSSLIDSENLHIIENGWVQAPNALNATLAYIPPFWHLDPHGVLYNSSAANLDYDVKTVRYQPSSRFLTELRKRLVEKRHSRYGQLQEITDIPVGSIAVFLQGDLPAHQGTAHCTTEAMLRAVAAGSGGRPVVVKAHPNSNQIADAKLVLRLMSEGLDFVPTDANIHDILAKCAVTVSFNSAVSVEGFLHKKPAILFGKSDFHHICETVTDPRDFPVALDRALLKKGGYAQYVYWYFKTNCLSLSDKSFADQLLARLETAGFGADRLGLRTANPVVPVPVPVPENSWIDGLEKAQAAANFLAETLLQKPQVKTLQIKEKLKLAEGSHVFSATLNGQEVVLKRFLGGDVAHTVNSLQGELAILEQLFGDGKYQANRCLLAYPNDGLVVLSFAPGVRLGDRIAKSSGKKRRDLVTQSAGWLAKYTSLRRRATTFGPGYWIKQLNEKDTSHITDQTDRALLDELLQNLTVQADRIKGCDVVQAATHGDFVGINAHFHAGVIYGVDIQGECWLAVAKEAARFLVWLQIHDPKVPGKSYFGLDQDDWDSFLDGGAVAKEEQGTTMPFFVGEQFYGRFIETYHRVNIRENTRAAILRYLSDQGGGG